MYNNSGVLPAVWTVSLSTDLLYAHVGERSGYQVIIILSISLIILRTTCDSMDMEIICNFERDNISKESRENDGLY